MQPRVLSAAVAVIVMSAARPALPADDASAAGNAAATLALGAYAAASYYHSTGYPGGAAATTGSSPAGFDVHAFDLQHDPFQVDEVGASLGFQPKEGLGALLDVMAGEDARILRQTEGGGSGAFDVRQGYAQYAAGPLTLLAGKLLPCAGAESINPTQSLNYSRSLLFTLAEPLTLTGARVDYAASATLTLDAGVNSGWNVTSIWQGWKSGEAGASWTPDKTLSLSLQSSFGELMPGGPQRTLLDLVLSENPTPSLTLLVSADWDRQGAQGGAPGAATPGGTWYGVAATVGYAPAARWRIALRAEYLEDAVGILTGTPGGQHLGEGTVTVAFKPAPRLELRAEWRSDFAQAPVFLRQPAPGLYGAGPRMTGYLGELALQAVYTFAGS